MNDILADQEVRERAATITDRNVVVTAGAGTGKTTLLIDRITHLIFRGARQIPLNQILALTFTNKTANEMVVRLRQRLLKIQELTRSSSQNEKPTYEGWLISHLQALYGLTNDQVLSRATETLRHIEHAHIETMHSFAASVLRLFPVEAGLDPSFQEDDGTKLDTHFHKEWSRWLDQELGNSASRSDRWKDILRLMSLEDLERLTRCLLDEWGPLSSFANLKEQEHIPESIRRWLLRCIARGQEIRIAHPKNQKIGRMLDAAIERLQNLCQNAGKEMASPACALEGAIPSRTQSWSDEEYDQARRIIKIAQASAHLIPPPLADFLNLVVPFVEECRHSFTQAGWISFNGLLVKTRDLLRDFPHVRRELKQQFAAILVDEFQDTDPVQYEIIVYLAEQLTQEASTWSHVQLEAGKLFIVGDPKQSIYAFRRADLEAYDAVIHDRLLGTAPYGELLSLQSNFRSHAGVLGPVNACCRQWFPQEGEKGVQPPYEDLLPVHHAPSLADEEGVQIRLVRCLENDVDAETATQAEAAELARWLAEEVFHYQKITINQELVPLQPGHVAILFRTLSHLRVYVEALRAFGIPFITEGEKHFFERQEVMDCIHLLRVLADPYDRLALVGVLRSPLGGCSDNVIANLLRTGQLDDWNRKALSHETPEIFQVLNDLRRKILTQPVADALGMIFQSTPFLELVAATRESEQAVSNIQKLEEMARRYAKEEQVGFRGVVERLWRWIHDPPPEAERSLVDDCMPEAGSSPGVVRLMSIHKAKGLEFPMVILAGLHRGTDTTSQRIWVDHDWLTDCSGFRVGQYYSLGGLYLESKMEIRQRAEHIRLLYVAMTRAQRRLVLSTGLPTTAASGSRGFLGKLMMGFGLELDELMSASHASHRQWLDIQGTPVSVEVVVEKGERVSSRDSRFRQPEPIKPQELDAYNQWGRRYERMHQAYQDGLFVSPSKIDEEMDRLGLSDRAQLKVSASSSTQRNKEESRYRQALIGTLAHHVLEGWNFQGDPELLPSRIAKVCNVGIPQEWKKEAVSIQEELTGIFRAFACSESYAMLREAEILGREVPIMVPFRGGEHHDEGSGSRAVLQGVIDVVYRWNNAVWLADYKTSFVTTDSLNHVVDHYREQTIAYAYALGKIFPGSPIGAHLIFLRLGLAVAIADPQQTSCGKMKGGQE